ncbi:hypothetical protein GGC64_006269 [Mycobacterium sp. OAS707]|uniref:hypothetical protein n=1 Tax=Mycobacterium sp. OAS707 TaxID=2663822 RepID=UPI00178AFA01|nr:hypothetical protein [Mycobacterium sp. OAS707]MBE1552182.1 hypothetical protein [Mycobacterium sp. OAS707]
MSAREFGGTWHAAGISAAWQWSMRALPLSLPETPFLFNSDENGVGDDLPRPNAARYLAKALRRQTAGHSGAAIQRHPPVNLAHTDVEIHLGAGPYG